MTPTPGPITWGTNGGNQWTIIGGEREIVVTTAAGGYNVTINQSIAEDAPGRGLIKAGNGNLTLTAANTYTGNTTVQDGILSLGHASLADWSTVILSHLATLNLNFPTKSPDTISAFFIDGVRQLDGTWGGIGSSAEHETPLITGTGVLLVTPYFPQLAGDFNNDGKVDAADYITWRKTGADPTAYDAWRHTFGNTTPAPASVLTSGGAVPEPATIALTFATFALPFTFRVRSRTAFHLRRSICPLQD
ncbi:MAG: autotransporter-associated beta strand repeat-containing protein [Candidatus Udaeobacter sp.]